MARLNKKVISEELNAILMLSGEAMIDFTKLSHDDIVSLRMIFTDPQKLVAVGKNMLASIVPGGTDIVRDFATDVLTNPEKAQALAAHGKEILDKSPMLDQFPLAKMLLQRGVDRAQQVVNQVQQRRKPNEEEKK